MEEFTNVIEQIVVQLPVVLVLVAGLILVAVRSRNLSGRARSLAIAGLGMLLLGELLRVAWNSAIPSIAIHNRLTPGEFGPISLGAGILLNVWQAAGLALLIGGAVSRAPRPAAPPPAPAYRPGPTGQPPGGHVPGAGGYVPGAGGRPVPDAGGWVPPQQQER